MNLEYNCNPNCPVCQVELRLEMEELWTCPDCFVPHHEQCWEYNDHRCAIYGCGDPEPIPLPQPEPEPEPVRRAPRYDSSASDSSGGSRWLIVWLLLSMFVGLAHGLSRSGRSSSDRRPAYTPPPRIRTYKPIRVDRERNRIERKRMERIRQIMLEYSERNRK